MKKASAVVLGIVGVLTLVLIANTMPFQVNREICRDRARLVTMLVDLREYETRHGHLPASLRNAIEALHGTNAAELVWLKDGKADQEHIVLVFDGTGGWLYNPVERVVGINKSGIRKQKLKIP